jgi:hypothetical protein
MSTPDQIPLRIHSILERLLARTSVNEVQWERAALPSSYAIDVATVRFRIRSASGDAAPPYVLEFLGDASDTAPIVTGETIDSSNAQLIQNLYNAARSNVAANSPDPFQAVEQQLDLGEA